LPVTPQMRAAVYELEKCLPLLHAHGLHLLACRVQQAVEVLARELRPRKED
jgi:hypothetical protein